jgi:serralysin
MAIILDGTLLDWDANDRLETAATTIAGYALYGRLEGDTFYFALHAPLAINATSTLWLNTDADITTGHKVWGFATGAEFNVNFGSDGVPRLYTGADGQTLVGNLTYAMSADRSVLEIALPKSLLGTSVTSVGIMADINNSVFLPADYTQAAYTINTPVLGPFDGLLTEWTPDQRLDNTPAATVPGYELYGKVDDDSFVFGVSSPVPIGANTTFWLNTDNDVATGHQIWGFAGGAEFNVNIDADGVARLYSGADAQTFIANIDYKIAPNGLSMEFAVPKSLLGPAVDSVVLLADINNSVFLPPNYSAGGYVLTNPTVTPAGPYDGLLTEWTSAQRLDGPTNEVAGYELYGNVTADKFEFALKSAVAIGPTTTFWLNTDADVTTGHQIWGFAGGAEFNVNIGLDGVARLYSGADGQTLVGEIDHKIAPDGMSMEFAVPRSLLGPAVTAITLLADVNNSVFLPASYSNGGYTLVDPGTATSKFDGILSEWTTNQRLETPMTTIADYEFYGQFSDGSFNFGFKSAVEIGPNTTFWLNTDGNTATGTQIFGYAGGAEFNVNIGADGVARLYSGNAGQTLIGDIDYKIGPDGKTIEFAIPKTMIGTSVSAISVLADVNDSVFLPSNYLAPAYTVYDPASLPVATDTGNKVAIVFSQTTAENYFSQMAYSQLVMAAQSQAMAAGIPFDLVSEADLTDLAKMVNYDTIIFPSFRNVPANHAAIEDVLTKLVYQYDVSLIAAGDFMTNDASNASLPGNAYARMESLFGLNRTGGDVGVTVDVKALASGHAITEGYGNNGAIHTYTDAATSYFAAANPAAGSVSIIAEQVINGVSHGAVLGSVTGSRNVHFSTDALLGDINLLGQAIDWVNEEAGGPTVSLHMTRNSSLFASRNDMDQSQETYDVDGGIYDALLPILQQWKTDYNFVGSYYVNVGFNPPDQETNWLISAPYYNAMRAMGNEIGSHSYTHPHDTNLLLPNVLTQAQLSERIAAYAVSPEGPGIVGLALATMTLEQVNAKLAEVLASTNPEALDPTSKAFLEATFSFQFSAARTALETNLGYLIGGAAVPGMPEGLPTAQEIMQYYDYLTGGASMVNAGYPGAIGYLTPDATGQVYIAPNMSFDFTLMGWLGLNPEQAQAKWAAEWAQLNANSDMPILVWPWHDYGVTAWSLDTGVSSPYTQEMFTSFIAAAYAANTEFVTLADLAARIKAFEAADFGFSVAGDVITMHATPQTGQLGTFALNLDDLAGKTIKSVANWYAYDADSVFLDADGGTFVVTLGDAAEDVTHITSIGSRAQLLSLTGNGTDLDFTIAGEGRVVIDLKLMNNFVYEATGATLISQVGDIMTLDLGPIGNHAVSIRQIALNQPATDIVISNQSVLAENTATRTHIADLLVIDPDTDPIWRNNVVTVSDTRFEIDGITGALYLKAGQSIDFETDATITMTLTAADGAAQYSKAITLSIGNENEAPADIVVSNQIALAENTILRTKIADLSVTDPDLVAEFRNNIVTVSDTRFEIDAPSGALYLKAGQVIDYEALGTLDLVLTASDGSLSVSKSITLNIQNVNELPTGAPTITGTAIENVTLSASGALIHDADGLGAFTYQWQRGNGTVFTNITGATSTTYRLTQADTDQLIRVALSYVDGGGTAETVYSTATSQVVDVLTTRTLAPLVANTARIIKTADLVGSELTGTVTIKTLTASIGTLVAAGAGQWTYTPPANNDSAVTFNYTATAGAKLAQGSAAMDLLPTNSILGTAGADTLAARTTANSYYGLAGNDTISGGAGNDSFVATLNDGNDRYIGGAGIDTYNLSGTSAGATVNLTTGKSTSSQTGTDTLATIENIIGSSGNDHITGSAAANVLNGGAGDDFIFGMAGNDTLIGGAGNDRLTGGAGRDVMTGGPGNDIFIFNLVSDTGKTATTRDIITDFTPGQDIIDLSGIDANTAVSGNQAFTLLAKMGSAFTGVRGQLQWLQQDAAGTANDRTIIMGDINGDRIADFHIELTGLITLGLADFTL